MVSNSSSSSSSSFGVWGNPAAWPLEELLTLLMRPPGGGIPTFSAGKGGDRDLQSRLYGQVLGGGSKELSVEAIFSAWKRSWQDLKGARGVILGVPLDTGAGIRRGAAGGPRALREALLPISSYREALVEKKLIDLGDLWVNPHLLHDDMLSQEARASCQTAMYGGGVHGNGIDSEKLSCLPVSALSQLNWVLSNLLHHYPHLRIHVLGGDHSVAWPVTEVLARRHPGTLGIVQPDAHTDLLESRLGVRYCFGTWSYHANDLLGRGGKLVQVGIRQSGRTQEHWESLLGVKQFWAHEIRSRPAAEVIAELVAHLKQCGVKHLYFSNDIDGTDESEAPATGTPAPDGVSSLFFKELIAALGQAFEWVGADLVEVAPGLGPDPRSAQRTCQLGAEYVCAALRAQGVLEAE